MQTLHNHNTTSKNAASPHHMLESYPPSDTNLIATQQRDGTWILNNRRTSV